MALPVSSITSWNRLEPRPRCDQIDRSLAAEVRDPVWMLTRQWQFGEFQGEDAASPALVTLTTQTGPLIRFRVAGREVEFDGAMPPERAILAEPMAPDFALRVELGQIFASLLADEGGSESDVISFQTQLGLDKPPDRQFDPIDSESQRFLSVCGGRSIDGFKVYRIAKGDGSPPIVENPDALERALVEFAAWVDEVFRPVGTEDPEAWDPTRLEYVLEADAVAPNRDDTAATGKPVVLAVHPGEDGGLDWDAFDVRLLSASQIDLPEAPVSVSLIPGRLRFAGMPVSRFWDFETSTTNFGDIKVDLRDLLKMLIIDFALIHGPDWYLIPFDQKVGTLTRIASLTVRDVFGGTTSIENANLDASLGTTHWSMFRTSLETGTLEAPLDFFFLPPTLGKALDIGPVIEDVRFARDEMANMVWAIERVTANDIGGPRRGIERDAAVVPPAAPDTHPNTPLRYQIASMVPVHWIPFLPVQLAGGVDGEVALERGAVLRLRPRPNGGEPVKVMPAGKLLMPQSTPYQIDEREVPRTGVRVQRVLYRARGFDGSTHVWVARRKLSGAGESQSGLRFDMAIPTER
jgi:hypothetical protein